jgi:hypothetical protein
VYFATAYGTVTGTEPPVAQGLGDDSIGPPVTPADVRAEQEEAKTFHAARLQREMREMRAQLDRLQREMARSLTTPASASPQED